jgi:ATP-dependent Lon protease
MKFNEQYTLIPLRDMIIFPYMITPVFVGRKKSINALEIADETDKKLFIALQKDPKIDNPGFNDLYNIGVIVKILQILKLPDGTVKVLFEGIQKAKIINFIDDIESYYVDVEILEDIPFEGEEADIFKTYLLNDFDNYVKANKKIPDELVETLKEIDDLDKISYMIASQIHLRVKDQQEILEENSVQTRVEKILEFIKTEEEIAKLDARIKQRVKAQMAKAQKEYYLNEQLKSINKELGRDEDFKEDIDEIETKIKEMDLPTHVEEKAKKELKKLKLMSPMSSESAVVRNYLDWIVSLPWGKYTEDLKDLEKAKEILDRDHFGLEKPKERILEFLAVKSLSDSIKGPILCFVGPPGVGKTSLAKSIAEAMNKKFVRISLGGVRDEAEIRGHRRTYIGALPGKLINAMKKAGSMNPVMLLDEIDKLGSDFRGDPSSALLEALDPEQNKNFNDHYLEIECDLSKVFFITTANTIESIPPALLDRMEIIPIAGYTEAEKLNIAKKFLLPKLYSEHHTDKTKVNITDSAIYAIIRFYTREAGVRNLERELASLLRKGIKQLLTSKNRKSIKINSKNIEKYLGIKKYKLDNVIEPEETGVATGLAWTPYGGDILQIEVAIFSGNGNMKITGHIGDVMQESAQTALSVVKSRAGQFNIPAYKFKDYDIHIHVPEGAVPKDGPSAGITICTALISALSELKVNCRIAMTGEINLRGRVLPIGGVKEKVLAAHRIGIKHIILPDENRKDLTEIPSDVRSEVLFTFVKSIDEVFDKVLIKK